MKKEVIEALAEQWEKDAIPPTIEDACVSSSNDRMVLDVKNAQAAAVRETKRECADALRMLVSMLG